MNKRYQPMRQKTDTGPSSRRVSRRARAFIAAALSAIFTLATAAAAASDSCATAASSPLLSLIRKTYHPNTSFSAKFTLTIYWSVREKEDTKRGAVTLAPRDRFRVTLGDQTYVSDGTTLWDYDAAAKQVVIKRLADVDQSTLPSNIFRTYIASYPFREQERTGESALLVWKSDSPKGPYAAIEVTANTKNGHITKCTLIDGNDNRRTFTFTATVFGKQYAKEAFKLAIPKDARVIDMRDR